MKAIIYARCSTNEAKQDVEVQLKELRAYCERQGWEFDEVFEYGSGYKKDKQPKRDEILNKIKMKYYDVFLVYSLDRFSRIHSRSVNALMDSIVYDYGCRFIALNPFIDSENEMMWLNMKPWFTYFAHQFSVVLGERIKKGIERKKELGQYRGGCPKKKVDIGLIAALKATGAGLRTIAKRYNEGKAKREQISYQSVKRVLQKHSEISLCGNS